MTVDENEDSAPNARCRSGLSMGRTACRPLSSSPAAGDAARAPHCGNWRLYVRCTKNPRHKQRQGFATLATRGPPEPPRAWLSPLTRGDPAVASVDHAAPVDHAALLEQLFARVK